MLRLRCALLLCLFSALFLGLSWGTWAQSAGPGSEGNSESALNRLIGISTQLSALNERLQGELQDSRQNSRQLQSMLEDSRRELEGLRQELWALKQELQALQTSSTALLAAAENSQTELTVLQEALRRAEFSLMNLEISFAAYRQTSQARINRLQRENRLYKWGCAAAGVLAAGLGTAFLLGR